MREDSDKDNYALGKEFPRIAETVLEGSPDGRYIVATVANGDGGEFAHYISDTQISRKMGPFWQPLTHLEDKVKAVHLGGDNSIYLLSVQDAPKGKNQDGRVNLLHSRKMTARLQAANASDHPILLRTTADAGHGMGTALSERIAQEADAFAFLFDQLGMKPLPAPTPTP